PELLEPLDPALVFGGDGPDAMAADILAFVERLRSDPAGAAALREACARHAQTRYGWDQVVVSLARTLTSLAEGAAPGAPATEPCEACGGSMRASRLLYDGQRYGRCPRCRARRLVTLPSAVEMLREYEVRYPRRFPPERIET